MILLLCALATAALFAEPQDDFGKLEARCRARMERAVAYLAKAQKGNGSFGGGELQTPLTALIVDSLIQSKAAAPSDPPTAKGLSFLQSKIRPDGSIQADAIESNYIASVCLSAFSSANKDRQYKVAVEKLIQHLKKEQWDEGEGIDGKDVRYGGLGYGGKSRPDLSVTAFAMEALHSAGVKPDDPVFRRAALFVGRCQNFSRDDERHPPAGDDSNDGGFFYTPIGRREGREPERMHSYGSMTCSGLRCLRFAGAGIEDSRLAAAKKWIVGHYTLKENPGRGNAGLYYYYRSFAKAMSALQSDVLLDEKNRRHEWRVDLIRAVLLRQRPDGSWANDDRHWMENDPRLATAYALSALGQAIEKSDEK
jgi:squalene-hopene/tetraprenyl-beta-curcumene cyclase